MNSLVTVCITTYNRKNNLLIAVRSVLTQTYSNIEIIIVDDCSDDGTPEFVKEEILSIYPNIRYFRHNVNKGLAVARNKAINEAKGKYFTFVDDDDAWSPNFLVSILKIVDKNHENYIYCASKVLWGVFGDAKYIESNLKTMLLLGYTPPVASQFYITASLLEVGGYNESIKSGVDHDLWISLAAAGYKVRWLDKVLVQTNTVTSSDRMTYSYKKRLSGVNDSIIIWQRKFNNVFDESFFSSLSVNYQYNTYKKFLKLGFFGNKKRFYKLIFKLPQKELAKDICRFIFARLAYRRFIHPTFFSSVTGSDKRKLVHNILIRDIDNEA
jgi:glycosyltransferase involved in cell wall biosynthesis